MLIGLIGNNIRLGATFLQLVSIHRNHSQISHIVSGTLDKPDVSYLRRVAITMEMVQNVAPGSKIL